MAKIIFAMPRGDEEFDELRDGEKMKVTCTVRKEGPDKACLVAVGGKTLEGYSDDEEEEVEEVDEYEETAEPAMGEALDEVM